MGATMAEDSRHVASSLRKIVRNSMSASGVDNCIRHKRLHQNGNSPEEEMMMVLENDETYESPSVLAKRRIKYRQKIIMCALALTFTIAASSLSQSRNIRKYNIGDDRGTVVSSLSGASYDAKGLPLGMGTDLADVTEPLLESDTPMLWDSSPLYANLLKRYYGRCVGLVQAAPSYGTKPLENRLNHPLLDVFMHDKNGQLFVNVDMSTYDGIERAKGLNLAQRHLADIIISPHLQETIQIFDSSNRGRFFALFQHPVERAASVFFYQHYLSSVQRYGAEYQQEDDTNLFKALFEYIQSGRMEENQLVRTLSQKLEGEQLTWHDLEIAKEVLRRKCIVGLTIKIEDSLDRFNQYFKWQKRLEDNAVYANGENIESSAETKDCTQTVIQQHMDRFQLPQLTESNGLWLLLEKRNKLDIELYLYVFKLYGEQSSMFSSRGLPLPN